MSAKLDRVTLVGGPADGDQIEVSGNCDLFEWRPVEERERIAARMNGRAANVHDPILYRRSRRTRTVFIYQP